MTLELTTTKTIKVEVEFPCFRRYGKSFMKAFDETHYIVADTYDFAFAIKCYNDTSILSTYFEERSETCSEDEFEAALQDVSEKIKTQIEQSFVTA